MVNKTALKQTVTKTSNDWCTPPWLFQRLQEIFSFEVDGASDGSNNLLPKFVTENDKFYWVDTGYKVFTNPPFNKTKVFIEIAKRANEFQCFLLPFRPETKLWHESIWPYATIFVFNRRIQYIHPETKQEVKGAAFPSCLIFYGNLQSYNLNRLLDLGVFVRKLND